ncbi:unnamed protein product [Coregonus sp. 'balchen']|nr:unnamed protein product [Coregonus sp. 'balchen']
MDKRVDLKISSAEVTDSVLLCHGAHSDGNPDRLYQNLSNERFENATAPLRNEVHGLEGTTVTMSYNYSSTSTTGNRLYWYHQTSAGKMPIFLLWMIDTEFQENTKCVDLKISSAEVKDSALYYCAMKTTVTGNSETCQEPWEETDILCEDLTPLKKEFCLEGTLLPCLTTTPEQLLVEMKSIGIIKTQHKGQRTELKKADPLKTQISAKLNEEKNRVDLEISSAEVTDSALYYYCAVRSTVTGNLNTLYKNLSRNHISWNYPSGHVTALEGGLVTLSCNYTSSSPSPDLFWYIQLTRDSPQYVLRRDRYSEGSNSDEFKKRFDSRLNFTSSSVPLTIQRLQLSDSAVYYCALKPTTELLSQREKRLIMKEKTCLSAVNIKPVYQLHLSSECTGDNVQQQPGGVIATEGGLVTLSCQYNTSTNNAYLYWYKQEANDFPKHILTRYSFGSEDKAAGFKEKFDASINAKTQSVPLTIQRLQLSDSALYYCALQPTATGNINGQTIEPIREEMYAPAGSNITLPCTYSSADPGSAPIFLLLTGVSSNPSVVKSTPPYPRLSVKLNNERTLVDLDISSAEVTDSQRAFSAGDSSGDGIFSYSLEEDVIHVVSVKLSCNYTVSVGDSVLWHHQYPTSAPPHFINVGKVAERVDLEISSDEGTNSTVYYCALQPTVTVYPETLYKNCTEAGDKNPCSMLFIWSIIMFSAIGASVEDIITPDRDVVDVMEGSSVKLSCRYNSSLTNSLLWYRQHPGSSPQFLILDYSGFITNTDSTKWSLTHEKEDNRVDLEISSAEVTDSALYYCGLKPTNKINRNNIDLYLYRQYPNQAPQFLLYKGAISQSGSEHVPDKRYTSKTSRTSTELVITILTLADTDPYYCALREYTHHEKLADPACSGCMLLWYNITLFICLFLCICSFYLDTLLLYVVKIYLSLFSGCRAEENVTQPTEDVMVLEGQPTTLSCLFITTDQSPYLFWYKQQANGKPIFMLRRDTFSPGEAATEFKDRFDARLNFTAKSVPLMIQRVQLSDSAVYYCALRSTCSGDHVQQQPGGVIATEGRLATLRCQYNTSATNAYLYWYKQEANDFPKHMLSSYSFGSGDKAAGFKKSLNAKTQSVPLMILRLQLTDSSVYYCALRPTVTTGYTAPFKKNCVCMWLTVRNQGSHSVITILVFTIFTVLNNTYHNDTGISFNICTSGSHGNDITPTTDKVIGLEGDVIKLSCNYSSASNLQWYRQYPGSSPIFLLLTGVSSNPAVVNATPPYPRLSVKLNDERTRVDLEISSTEVTDSALYYCALQPTVTGNPETLNGQTIEPTREEVYVPAGSNITLSCTYSSAVSLQWYLQDPGSAPQYILLILHGVGSSSRAPGLDPRLSVKINDEKTCVDLGSSSAEVTDSALYYCAVRPTVTGNLHTLYKKHSAGTTSAGIYLGEEAVEQQSGHVTALEGGLVTLSCNYTTSSTSPDLFWYIQLTRDSPQYILRRDRYSEGSNSDEFKERFDSGLNFTSSSVPLTIQRLQPSDSALYYALRSTVTSVDSVTAQKLRVECY